MFGLPFVATGAAIVWFALREHRRGAPAEDAPWWVLGCVGLAFAGAGSFVSGGALRRWLRQWRVDRAMRAHPDEPWRAEFKWDPRHGHDVSTPGSVAVGLAFLIGLCAFLAPFNYWAWQEGPGIVMLVTFVFDLLPVAVVVGMAGGILHRLKYGQARLRLDTFPFFLGEEAAVRLVAPRALGRAERVEVTLRCVEGDATPAGTPAPAALHEETRAFDAAEMRVRLEDGALPFRFALPADGPETWLGHDSARRWEIDVHGTAPGLDFRRKFLVPVYRRRRTAE